MPKWRIMARNLGQAVALQKLAIDEEAMVTTPRAWPETSAMPEHEQNAGQRTVRRYASRTPFSPDQQHDKRIQPKHDSQVASGMKRRQKERVASETPAIIPVWQPEDFHSTERPYSERRSEVHPRPRNFNRTSGKHKAHAFATTAPQPPTGRRKPRTASASQARRAVATKRSASR